MTIEVRTKSATGPPGKEVVVRPTGRDAIDRWKRVPTLLTPKRIDPAAAEARRAAARAAARVTGQAIALPTYHAPAAAGRGAADVARAYFRWLSDADAREQAAAEGKLHTYTDKHRSLVKENMKFSLIGLAMLLIAGLAFWFLTPGYAKVLLLLLTFALLVLRGWRKRGGMNKPHSVNLLGITREKLNAIFLRIGLLKNNEEIDLIEMPHKDGKGVALVVDFPGGVDAADALSIKGRVASGFRVNPAALVLTPVRGADGHAGRLHIWAMQGDPFAAGSGLHPLLREREWNAWDAAPFGIDARGNVVSLKLVGGHMLIGAAPAAGKSFAGRSVALPYLLDPSAIIHIADGKGSDTWRDAACFAATYIEGDQDEHALAVSRMLDGIIDEARDRNAHKIKGSKLTEMRSRDECDPVPLILVIIDEMQELTSNTAPDPDSNVRNQTLGKSISEKLMKLGKLARSAGVILVCLTQRPDEDALPKGLRAVLMTRFALRTRDRHNSDLILGPEMSARGYRTDDDMMKPGVGVLIPNDNDNSQAAKGVFPTLRTFEVPDGEVWEDICGKAARLRENAGTLPAASPERPRVAVIEVDRPDAPERRVIAAELIPEPLEAAPERRAIEMSSEHIRMLEMLAKLPREMKVIQVTSLAASLGMETDDLKDAALPVSPTRAWVDTPEGKRQRICFRVRELITSINNRYREDGDAEIVDFRR